MNVAQRTSIANDDFEGSINPSHVRPAPYVIPKVPDHLAKDSDTGVSTHSVPFAYSVSQDQSTHKALKPHWFALRTTYGRERKAYEYLVKKDVQAFCPTITRAKIINGKRKMVTESRLPNLLFAYGTEEALKSYVFDNVNLPYLRFYYTHFHKGNNVINQPLIIPDKQIESLKIICAADAEDIIISDKSLTQLQAGQKVRIIQGKFTGVTGVVGRCYGQQRVAVIIPGLLTVCTAYIPGAFLEPIEEQ